VKLIDDIAERIQLLGGVSIAMAADVAEISRVPRPPRDRESPRRQLSRLLEAHEVVIREVGNAARDAADHGDDGTNDLLVSSVLRTNELQVWFLAEHLAGVPVTRAEENRNANQ
jgi:starvation-inducible DNA-binding protein